MGSKKTTQTNKPIYSSQILGAANTQQAAYNAQAPKIAQTADSFMGLSNDLLARFKEGDPAITAAKGYVTDTLSGDPAQNPYLDQMVSQTNDSVRNAMQAKMGTRGLTGGSDYYGLIGRELAKNETGLRYNDYDRSMQRRAQAAGMAPGIVSGEYIPVAAAMEAGQSGALMPLQAAIANSAGVGGLLGQYQNSQTKQKAGFTDILGMGLQAASLFSDSRLKKNVKRVGRTEGGLTIYDFEYVWGGPVHRGVMAQEVAKIQPEALGPIVDGYMTVNYSLVY